MPTKEDSPPPLPPAPPYVVLVEHPHDLYCTALIGAAGIRPSRVNLEERAATVP